MEGQIADSQHALELATTEYLNERATLHPPLRASTEPSLSHLDETSENCDGFIESTREELLRIELALKTARNQQAFINRLPPELHAKIFEYDLDANKPDINTRTVSSIRLSRIVSLSAVCTHWRKLVVGTGSFWSHIPIHLSENLVALCVKRANSIPLEVMAINKKRGAKNGSNRISKGENALRGHSHNIQSLTVSAFILERIHSLINCVLESSIPRSLRELSVTYTKANWTHEAPTEPDTRPKIRLDTLTKDLYTLRLRGIYIDWNECAFEKLCMLKLDGLHALRLAELEQALVASPMLQVLEISRSELYGSRTSSKPLALPHLKTLRLIYMEAALGMIVDMLEPGDYTTELDVSMYCAMKPPLVSKEAWIQELQRIVPKMCHVTVLGIRNEPHVLEEASFLSIDDIIALPDLITLRLQGFPLEPKPILVLEKVLQSLPQINKLQLRRVIIKSTETFQDMIERCAVQRIELINCRVYSGGKILRIERGTPLYKWALESAPRVSLLWE
ncbi:unnamed protein product [Rhizoctonia solani]|nr:unnamed protein product [Rhizoctonia solani]